MMPFFVEERIPFIVSALLEEQELAGADTRSIRDFEFDELNTHKNLSQLLSRLQQVTNESRVREVNENLKELKSKFQAHWKIDIANIFLYAAQVNKACKVDNFIDVCRHWNWDYIRNLEDHERFQYLRKPFYEEDREPIEYWTLYERMICLSVMNFHKNYWQLIINEPIDPQSSRAERIVTLIKGFVEPQNQYMLSKKSLLEAQKFVAERSVQFDAIIQLETDIEKETLRLKAIEGLQNPMKMVGLILEEVERLSQFGMAWANISDQLYRVMRR